MAPRDQDTAAALIQRLLEDPVLRDRFRRDPAGTLREAGLGEIADEVPREADGKLMQTLDIRESRSSRAGAMMAAAIEGFGVYEGSSHLIGHVDSAQAAEPHAHAAANAASGASVADLGEDDGGDDEDDSDNSGDDGGDDSGDDGGSDDDQDAPGEGSNGEDANDDSSDGDSSNDDSSNDGSDSSDNNDSSDSGSSDSGSSDSGSSDSGSSDSGDDALSQIDGPNDYPGDSASQQSVAAW